MPSENRPAPAVGQVWVSAQGNRFLVADKSQGLFILVFGQGRWTRGNIHDTDTYIGQFRGFKVQGDK